MKITRREAVGLIAGAASTLAAGRASADDKEIVIGVSIPLTGPGAATGITTQRTFEHAVRD